MRSPSSSAPPHRGFSRTLLLPTVIVPGYLNEDGGPSREVPAVFRRHGYVDAGAAQNVFWFTYPSRQVTLPDGARALAAYVRRVVLPGTYAARVNIVGYSLGGLMARWNVAYDTDGWGTLVNRLVLVGVPNEGTVMAYLGAHAPSVLPFSGLGRTPAAAAFLPTFPFWRAASTQPWSMPAGVDYALLAGLNARVIPPHIRVVFSTAVMIPATPRDRRRQQGSRAPCRARRSPMGPATASSLGRAPRDCRSAEGRVCPV